MNSGSSHSVAIHRKAVLGSHFGRSLELIIRWSQVRVLVGPPFAFNELDESLEASAP
jgi:hypothetical protein